MALIFARRLLLVLMTRLAAVFSFCFSLPLYCFIGQQLLTLSQQIWCWKPAVLWWGRETRDKNTEQREKESDMKEKQQHQHHSLIRRENRRDIRMNRHRRIANRQTSILQFRNPSLMSRVDWSLSFISICYCPALTVWIPDSPSL